MRPIAALRRWRRRRRGYLPNDLPPIGPSPITRWEWFWVRVRDVGLVLLIIAAALAVTSVLYLFFFEVLL